VKYWIHPEAEADLGDAAVYYATHASRAIAEAFLAEYERVRDLLVENQQRGPHGAGGMRIYHFDRFPYTVVYAEDERMDRKSLPSRTKAANLSTGSVVPNR
jgi:plasmid stabilization system protein ParE